MTATVHALVWPSVVISVLAQVLVVAGYFAGQVTPVVALTVLGLQLVAGWAAVSFEIRARSIPMRKVSS